jgi:hypothetical protein
MPNSMLETSIYRDEMSSAMTDAGQCQLDWPNRKRVSEGATAAGRSNDQSGNAGYAGVSHPVFTLDLHWVWDR